jgi:hypothetical protein
MLYKLTKEEVGLGLEALPFFDVGQMQKIEKDLENLLARHLFDVLFEDEPLMPVFQERKGQPEADLYALNKNGDLVIFELKPGTAGEDAVPQVLRYAQMAGRWRFGEIEDRYGQYMQSMGSKEKSLQKAHRDAFELEHELPPSEFNRRQHLYVIGNAADENLIAAVDYWKRQGISINFIPYRIYRIGEREYFEFFSLPYDRHSNSATVKGVLFDTNISYDEESVWEMMEKSRVAAYGGVKHVVEYLNPKDIVFFSHKGAGIIAAAEVTGQAKSEGSEEQYRDVKFITRIPDRQQGIKRYLSFSDVAEITGKNFFWARTVKVPYLSKDEADKLLARLQKALESA